MNKLLRLTSNSLAVATLFGTLCADALAQTVNEAAKEHEAGSAMEHTVKAPTIDFDNLRDPFSSYLTRVAARGAALIEAQRSRLINREPEILEGFDLSTLRLVAIYRKGEDRVAMIEDATGKGYIVRRGNYMGKNNGRIEKIDADTVHLVEQVINPAGELVDNQVTLTLKEVNE